LAQNHPGTDQVVGKYRFRNLYRRLSGQSLTEGIGLPLQHVLVVVIADQPEHAHAQYHQTRHGNRETSRDTAAGCSSGRVKIAAGLIFCLFLLCLQFPLPAVKL